MNERYGKRPGPMVQDTDFDPADEQRTIRTAPEFERELWVRQARATLQRQALVEEGVTAAAKVPSALNQGSTINAGTYNPWFPVVNCGTVADDAVSGFCGTAAYDLIHLNCGGA